MEEVVLVDVNDSVIGFMEKMEAHKKGLLHRAFSVFIFNSNNELLLQQRAISKYHSGGLWTNTCCSHPRKNETFHSAANRRLSEEMGMVCELKEAFNFTYKSHLDKGLIEHEFDWVFVGKSNKLPNINKEEVESYKYIDLNDLVKDIDLNPGLYTEWLKICINRLSDFIFKTNYFEK
jgi:isopentenyl-diphosphate delta-isomerase